MIRLLKLSNKKDFKFSSREILDIHLEFYNKNSIVTYSTNIPVNKKPEYVVLVLGNVENVCYLCHVSKHEYLEEVGKSIDIDFINNSPIEFKDDDKKTWLMFDSIKEITTDYWNNTIIVDFIKSRANNKKLDMRVEE